MNYECADCGREEYWTVADVAEGTYPEFSSCPLCEQQICGECYEKHNDCLMEVANG